MRDMGIEPHEYDIIEGDEITVTKRKPKKNNSSDESEEYDWWEAQRRKNALKRSKVVIK